MENIINSLRIVLGTPDFYDANWQIHYGMIVEYLVGAIVLCVVITSVFRFLGKLVSR